jgi:predicted permease
MFDNHALSKAAILIAFVMPLYNTLAVIALTVPVNDKKQVNYIKTIIEILSNPLILAIFAALPVSLLKIPIPRFLTTTIEYLAALTLPLALIGIGASLNFESVRKDLKLTSVASVIKLIILPAILTYAAIISGFTGQNLAIMFILFATPTAIATFIMTEAMGSNSELAGNIIVTTTLGSIFTISLGIYILRFLKLI